MDIPAPKPAQVLSYAYLWAHEYATGREEGTKDRPVAVIVAVEEAQNRVQVVVVPITHRSPAVGADAIEIPTVIKTHLRLDDNRSWVVLDQMNVFVWPGPDLRPADIPGADTVLYGHLPAGFFRTIRDRVAANIRAGRLRQVPRSE